MEYIKKEVNGKIYEYIRITELPSMFIPYGETKEIFVRGLRASEIKALARVQSGGEELTVFEICSIYADAIQGVAVADLVEIDFVALASICNLHTKSSAGWSINQPCVHSIPIIDKDEYGNELETRYEPCPGVVNQDITLTDLEFSEPKFKTLPIEFTSSDGDKVVCTLPTMKSLDWQERIKDNPSKYYSSESDANLFTYCSIIKSVNGSEDIGNIWAWLRDCTYSDLKIIEEIDDKLVIDTLPITLTCPSCGKPFKFELGLTYQKAYP